MVLVSACLAGIRCTYNGRDREIWWVKRMVMEGKAIPLCPEVLGGLPIPRPPAEIAGGTGDDVLDGKRRVLSIDGKDVTKEFVEGAMMVVKICEEIGIKEAILAPESPSCGCRMIHNGTFTGALRSGMGVTAAALRRAGIEAFEPDMWRRKG
jgi:uncharacterized protein YbbK (DUF523 family)